MTAQSDGAAPGDVPPPAIVEPANRFANQTIARPAMKVSRVEDVVARFDTATHVYYLPKADGQPPIPLSQLEKLAQYLGKTDFYLVVVGNSSGTRYTGINGRVFKPGKEVLKGLLGQQLFTNETFMSITDSRLGEPVKSGKSFHLGDR